MGALTTDAGVLAILKEYYGNQDVEAILFRNDPILGRIKKERIGGKYIPLPMVTSGSGNVSGDYTTTLAAANVLAASYKAVSMQVQPARLFSSFILDPLEYLTSQGDIAAFRSIFSIRCMLAMDDLRKVLATCLYRTGRLEMGTALTVTNASGYFDVDPSSAMAVKPNSLIYFAATINGAVRTGVGGANAVYVTSVQTLDSGNVRITVSATLGGAAATLDASIVAGDWFFLAGGRDTSYNPVAPGGLASWIPSFYNRTGSSWYNGTNGYIDTAFNGIVRSAAVDQLAGWFVKRNASSGETYSAALLRLVKLVRRGGGKPEVIVVNDDDFQAIINETLANRTFFQNMGAISKKGDATVNQGLSQLSMVFSTSWINSVVETPYCPKGVAYVLDMDSIRLYGISSTAKILDKLPIGNDPGGPEMSEAFEVSTQFQFLAEDMYSVTPTPTSNGQGSRVDFTFFGNFAVTAPGHNGVCVFN
jgi:hypothetical protein